MSVRVPREEAAGKFSFNTGDLVLVKWNDGMVYFAKIKRIDHKRSKCLVVFDDKSQDEASFDQIHSVDETTTDIICIKCKKDNSDIPNEIVLCDRCGIGFHQRCHIPSIPASALDLATPWNCSYCQRGIKCPYLTESLDVLQNLLSDEEREEEEEEEAGNVSAEESDGYEDNSTSEDVVARKRKDLRSLDVKSKQCLPPPAKKVHTSVTVNTVGNSTWKSKVANEPQPTTSEAKDLDYPSPRSSSTPEGGNELMRKRKKRHPNSQKKHKRASVESRTVSVQRLPVSIHDDSSTSTELDASHDSNTVSESDSMEPCRPPKLEHPVHVSKKRPRSLRVSLSLPEEVEEGTPLDKVVKAHRLLSPRFRSQPTWEDFSDNVTVQPKKSSPRPTSPSSSVVSLNGDTPARSAGVQLVKKMKLSIPEKEVKPQSRVQVPFVATPLPGTPTRIPSIESPKQEALKEASKEVLKVEVKHHRRKSESPEHIQRKSPPSTLPCKEPMKPTQPKSAATPVIQSAATPVIQSAATPVIQVAATPVITTKVVGTPNQIPTNSPSATTNLPVVKSTKGSQGKCEISDSGNSATKSGILDSKALVSAVNSLDARSAPTTESKSTRPSALARHSPPDTTRQSSPDLIITAVESPKTRLVSITAKTAMTQSEAIARGANSAKLPDSRQTSQILEARAGQKKVTAKIVEIQQIPAGASQTTNSSPVAGSFVIPIASQTPVSMVPVMVSPTMTAQQAVASPQYYTSVPAVQTTQPQTPVQYIAAQHPVQKTQVTFPLQPPPYSAHMKAKANYVYVVPTTSSSAVASVAQTAAITTTKPYAIVNALPPSATSQSGMQYIADPASLQSVGYVQLANTPAMQLQGRENSASSRKAIPASSRLTTSPNTVQQKSLNVVSLTQNGDPNVSLHSISKKIEGAFATCSEDMLISAFEDAWKKFQANDTKFKSAPQNKGSIVPPNAEVVSIPGTDSRLSLVRPVRSRPKPIAPKVNAAPISHIASTVQQPQQAAVQYVQYSTPNQQVFTVLHQGQDGTYRKQAKTYQSSGLFYPSPASDTGNSIGTTVVDPALTATVRGTHSISQKVVAKPTVSSKEPNKGTRVCTLCGKDATYLCSGCHNKWYCGRECQLKAWDTHSKECKS